MRLIAKYNLRVKSQNLIWKYKFDSYCFAILHFILVFLSQIYKNIIVLFSQITFFKKTLIFIFVIIEFYYFLELEFFDDLCKEIKKTLIVITLNAIFEIIIMCLLDIFKKPHAEAMFKNSNENPSPGNSQEEGHQNSHNYASSGGQQSRVNSNPDPEHAHTMTIAYVGTMLGVGGVIAAPGSINTATAINYAGGAVAGMATTFVAYNPSSANTQLGDEEEKKND